MNLRNIGLALCLLFGSSMVVPGQIPIECSTEGLAKAKFKVYSIYSTRVTGVRVVVPPELQTDENLRATAGYLKRKYCENKPLIVQVFDTKKDAREYTVYQVRKIPETLRAIYHFDAAKGKESLARITVRDSKQFESAIELRR